MADITGQQIGNYHLIRLIGKGPFGEVYLGEHRYLTTLSAVKLLDIKFTDRAAQNFQREARVTTHLRHRNIVRILEFGVTNDSTPYIVMEYFPQGSLHNRHPRGSRVPLETVVSYVKQIANALQYIHEQNIVHRNVKPENMLIGSENEILLSDTGLAVSSRDISNVPLNAVEVSLLTYMAPEQIEGRATPSSDQYALGVTVYEWLSGRPPFTGSGRELASQHLFSPPPSLRVLVPVISTEVEAVVLRALAKKPEDRFPTVISFALALEQAVLSNRSFPWGQYVKEVKPANSAPMTPVLPPPPPNFTQANVANTYSPTIPANTGELVPVALDHLSQSQYVTPNPNISVSPPLKRNTSRRTFITSGLIGLAALAGAEIFASTWKNSSSPFVAPTPNANGVGAILVTYTGHAGPVLDVAWSPDGTHIASAGGDNKVQVWSGLSKSIGAVSFVFPGILAHAVAWSPDSKQVAFSDGSAVQARNADGSGQPFVYRGHSPYTVNAVAWSPDGRHIASASDDLTVQVWDAIGGTYRLIYRKHSHPIEAVAWSPDSLTVASGSLDGTVQVWDITTGADLFSPYQGHSPYAVFAVAWSPDGKHIASAGNDHTVQVWNATDRSLLYAYREHTGAVTTVAWSPNGTHIASGSADKTVQLWNASDGSVSYIYRDHTDVVNTVTWSPDGKYIASGSADKTVRVWRA